MCHDNGFPRAVITETGEELPDWFLPVFTPLLERGGEFWSQVRDFFVSEGLVPAENSQVRFFLIQLEFPPENGAGRGGGGSQNIIRQLENYGKFQRKMTQDINSNDKFRGFSYSLNGHLYFLLSYENLKELHSRFQEAIDAFNQENFCSMRGIISVGASSFNDMPLLQRDIIAKNEYRRYMKLNTSLLTSEINVPAIKLVDTDKSTASLANTLDDMAKNLNNRILSGDEAGALEVLEEFTIFAVNEAVKRQFSSQLNMLSQMFVNSLERITLKELTLDINFWQNNNPEFDLIRANDSAKALEIWKSFVNRIFAYQSGQKERNLSSKIIEIRNYITENFNDPSLCIQSVADHFEISRGVLTKEYSKFFGEGINETVHRLRVSKSKFLLQTTNMPVSDIAGEVGYSNQSTMYRAFLKYEGLPPGKFSRKL